MIVARIQEGQPPLILDRLREMVRLREGLDENHHNITPEVQQRALACLQRFGQRPGLHLHPEAVEQRRTPPAQDADDFFVLPGESLAKYRGPSEEGEEFGERRLTEAATRCHALRPREFMQGLLKTLGDFRGGERSADDLTLMLIRRAA